jgi:hypothetical protein
MCGGLFSHLQGVTILGLPAGPRGSTSARPSILDLGALLSVPLLPALQYVGHDGKGDGRGLACG